MTPTPPIPTPAPASTRSPDEAPSLEARLADTGHRLHTDFSGLIAAVASADTGPQALAKRLGIDKVLASRLLKAVRAADPLSVIHRIPGPEPLRRVLKGAAKAGVEPKAIADARHAVDALEELIRDEIGDRAALDTIVAAWVPEARREFELRRKQTLFRANADLRGSRVELLLASAFLTPNPDGEHNDVAWLHGLVGLRRLRPGAPVTLASRRMGHADTGRQSTSIAGVPINGFADMRLPELSSTPAPTVDTIAEGDTVRYALRDDAYGPGADLNLAIAEINRGELSRYADEPRRSFVFAEVSTPARALCFDLFVHDELFFNQSPEVLVHDTAFGGVVNPNDPARNSDRLDLLAAAEPLGSAFQQARLTELPGYTAALARIASALGHDPARLRGYRCRIAYPVFGTQVSLTFQAALRPE